MSSFMEMGVRSSGLKLLAGGSLVLMFALMTYVVRFGWEGAWWGDKGCLLLWT